MDEHFAAFSFVDRITQLEAGKRARGVFAIPAGIREFPPCLVAEAVGQLAAWVAMSAIEYRGRPVAALAAETRFHGDVYPGQTLELGVELDHCDDEAVAYGGWADVNGRQVTELEHCLGPMLPTVEFDAPEALRERFALICGEGAPPGRFAGVDLAAPVVTEHTPGRSLHATLQVPTHAWFFGDHFPRRAVFPATLLLDAQMRLAARLAAETPNAQASALVLRRMNNVKVRSFTTPGQTLELGADATPQDDGTLRIALSARNEGKVVATARVEFGTRASNQPSKEVVA
jgi:3-hydroxymyristoyl/3-hydroxydecanoyl-(acyl carrier protein) dehydratase